MKTIADTEPIIIEADVAVNTPFESDLTAANDSHEMPLGCRLRWHRWTRWGRVIIERSTHGSVVVSERRYQTQICLGCGERRERKVALRG